MEFKISERRLGRQKRESVLAAVFLVLLLVAGGAGIIGPALGIKRIAAGLAYVLFIGLILIWVRKDFLETRRNMQSHRLILENGKIAFENGAIRQELDLQKVHSIRFRRKGGQVRSILVDIEKGRGFKIQGYEGMEEIAHIMLEKMDSSIIAP